MTTKFSDMPLRVSPDLADLIGWRELCAPMFSNGHDRKLDTPSGMQPGKNIVVFTGNQCAGKTTLIAELKKKGIAGLPERVREIMEQGRRVGFTDPVLKGVMPEILETSVAEHVEQLFERRASSDSPLVADRGIGDYLGALKLFQYATKVPGLLRRVIPLLTKEPEYLGLLTNDVAVQELKERVDRQVANLQKWAKVIQYDKVLWLETLPKLEVDGIRSENWLTQNLLPFFIKQAWYELGYTLTSIPPFYGELRERVDYVLQRFPKAIND